MAIKINLSEAKAHLSQLLDKAIAGEDIIITRSGRPLVRLTPVVSPRFQRVLGTAKGDFVVPGDFNDPLPDHVLAMFEK